MKINHVVLGSEPTTEVVSADLATLDNQLVANVREATLHHLAALQSQLDKIAEARRANVASVTDSAMRHALGLEN